MATPSLRTNKKCSPSQKSLNVLPITYDAPLQSFLLV